MSAAAAHAVASGSVPVPARYDLLATLAPLGLGGRDRCARPQGAGVYWRATRTPEGPGTARYAHEGSAVVVQAWGPGAGWLVAAAPALLGVDRRDEADAAAFGAAVAGHPVLGPMHRARAGFRIGRSGAVYEALLPAICAQKVTGLEAKRAWNGIVDRWGQGAPGPEGLRLPPRPERLAELGYEAFHRLGVERKRAEVLRAVAAAAPALDALAAAPPDTAEARLRAVPGIGVWTAAEVRRVALGDGDAVSFGDYHLPNLVAFNLAGTRQGTDELLAELLEPYRPHRGRVVRLLELAGRRPARRGPRLAPNGLEHR